MGILDIFKKKGLNPNISAQREVQSVNGVVLQPYYQKAYVTDGYMGNSDVYAIVTFLAQRTTNAAVSIEHHSALVCLSALFTTNVASDWPRFFCCQTMFPQPMPNIRLRTSHFDSDGSC